MDTDIIRSDGGTTEPDSSGVAAAEKPTRKFLPLTQQIIMALVVGEDFVRDRVSEFVDSASLAVALYRLDL